MRVPGRNLTSWANRFTISRVSGAPSGIPKPGLTWWQSTTLTPNRAQSDVPSSNPASRPEIPTRS